MKKQKVADIIKSGFDGIKAESGFYVWWFPQEAANKLIEPLKKFIDDDRLKKYKLSYLTTYHTMRCILVLHQKKVDFFKE